MSPPPSGPSQLLGSSGTFRLALGQGARPGPRSAWPRGLRGCFRPFSRCSEVPSGAGGGSGHGSLRLGLHPTVDLSGTRGGDQNKARRSHSKSWCVTTRRGADSLSGFSGLPTKVFPEPGGLSRPRAFTSRSLAPPGRERRPAPPLLPWLRAARCPGPCPPELTPVSPWVPTPTTADATRLGCPRASMHRHPQSLGDFRTFTQGDLPLNVPLPGPATPCLCGLVPSLGFTSRRTPTCACTSGASITVFRRPRCAALRLAKDPAPAPHDASLAPSPTKPVCACAQIPVAVSPPEPLPSPMPTPISSVSPPWARTHNQPQGRALGPEILGTSRFLLPGVLGSL